MIATVLAGLARWSVATLELSSVLLRIAAGNTASRAVAERAGFVEVGIETGGGKDGDGVDDLVIYVWEPGSSSGK